jgi:hypothetical protein
LSGPASGGVEPFSLGACIPFRKQKTSRGYETGTSAWHALVQRIVAREAIGVRDAVDQLIGRRRLHEAG